MGISVILTHEQADFDALASLFGAHLLSEESLPVLPSKLNRNLKAFLTLYSAAFPFVERRDLPNEPVEKVTLVDTQSIVTVRGMSAETEVQVIDHHTPRMDLPKGWKIWTEETGANTTLFVEEVIQRGTVLEPIQATLLLLGIYEDTGSLTYSRTTPRDLRSAAFLIEQGANLNVAIEFLNHPLSMEQEQMFQVLLRSASSQEIHGHHVVMATADAREHDEELSTIAHKLRNVLESDALFLLFQTRGGVQMIARSTNDYINVAEIATHFNGGGHNRAAAALIKDGVMDEVKNELLKILPAKIRPAVTVGQLMSLGPQVLPAETPVAEAASRMQRFGHEGYPVVESGKVVGLLTRRSVDRAIAHNLNLTARSLMTAGEVTITPEDSVEELQNRMTETGWGQIPVINAESGEIIGIVTRTDLLKTLSADQALIGRNNFAARLEASLPAARLMLLKEIARVAYEKRIALYIVGGFVRDLLLERPSSDYDLVAEGDAISLAKALQRTYGGKLTSHSRFGTAKWHIANIRNQLARELPSPEDKKLSADDLPEFLDLISARTEFYTAPTALPTVERGSIKLDLHRRDFTINTLALRLDGPHYGELHDYWGGLNDLNQGLVRVLHSISFVDDPTRMLRAVRYEQRYGFQIEARTLQLLEEARALLGKISGERVRHELDHILDEEQRCGMLKRLHELDLLSPIHRDLSWDSWLEHKFGLLNEKTIHKGWAIPTMPRGYPLVRALAYTIWLIRLPERSVTEFLEKIVMPNNLGEMIASAVKLWQELQELSGKSPSEITFQLETFSPLAIFAAFITSDDVKTREILKMYNEKWQHIAPSITGHDLRMRGLPPGPRYQEVLLRLRQARLDGEVHTNAEEQSLLERLLAS